MTGLRYPVGFEYPATVPNSGSVLPMMHDEGRAERMRLVTRQASRSTAPGVSVMIPTDVFTTLMMAALGSPAPDASDAGSRLVAQRVRCGDVLGSQITVGHWCGTHGDLAVSCDPGKWCHKTIGLHRVALKKREPAPGLGKAVMIITRNKSTKADQGSIRAGGGTRRFWRHSRYGELRVCAEPYRDE
jgi:hypothetical protein